MHNLNQRFFFIDFLKAISIVAVVSFHSMFVPSQTYQSSVLILESIFAPLRFCVPVLLVISFFLLEKSFENSQSSQLQKPKDFLSRKMYRLIVPSLFWFAFAGIKLFVQDKSLFTIVHTYLTGTIFSGSYYLLILFQGFPLFILLRKKFRSVKGLLKILLFEIIIYCLVHIVFNTNQTIESYLRYIGRPIFVYYLYYLALGIFLYSNFDKILAISKSISVNVKALSLIATAFLFAFENRWLYVNTQAVVPPFEYIMLSCIISPLVLFVCFIDIKRSTFSREMTAIVQLLSKYSLGIFCINGIFSRYFAVLGNMLFADASFTFIQILLIKLISCCFLLLLSLGLSMLIHRLGFKQLVS